MNSQAAPMTRMLAESATTHLCHLRHLRIVFSLELPWFSLTDRKDAHVLKNKKMLKSTLIAAAVAAFIVIPVRADIDPTSPIADALRKAEASVQKIVAIPSGERTFENTVLAIDDVIAHLQIDTNLTQFMAHVSTDADERDRGAKAEEHYMNWMIELGKNEPLYNAVKEVSLLKKKLDPVHERLLKENMRDYRRAGMDLPPDKREQLKKIQMEVTRLQLEFDRNIRDDETTVAVTRDELAGMPSEFIDRLQQSVGLYMVTMDYPTFQPIMDQCENELTRQRAWTAYKRRGGKKNVAVLEKFLKLRTDAAHLLGFASPADYECEVRMSKNAAAVADFYKKLRPMVREKAKLDWQEYQNAKRTHTGDANAILQPWDQSFYEKYLQRTRYAVDQNKVQEYFPMERVVDGLFSITQSLYGLEYRDVTEQARRKPRPDRPMWHEDVKLYEVWDKASQQMLGEFYLDLHPRENKYNHAAQWGLVPRKKWRDGTIARPLAALVCNFTKPTADKPSLLTHNEVETFFHEFGHCLHTILTESDIAQFSGTEVEGDFVEAPSQMFENWVWDAGVLNTFAGHYKTGEPLPKELVDGMIAARNLGSGMFAEHQFYYGLVDQNYHNDQDGVVDTTAIANELFSQIELYKLVPGVFFQASFGHLSNPGYVAGYYGYQWSLVYAQDMFSRFKELGMLDPKAGATYRQKILARGGTMDAIDMIKDFLGREPSMDAYLEHLGLKK
jgi:thimet oligopeptidase